MSDSEEEMETTSNRSKAPMSMPLSSAAAAAVAASANGQRVMQYVDTDGTTMEWDEERRAYFPKLDETFIYRYQTAVEALSNPNATQQQQQQPIQPIQPIQPTYQSSSNTAVTPSAAAIPVASVGWRECEDDDGNVFYYHTGTGATQTEKPEGFDSQDIVTQPAAQPSKKRQKEVKQEQKNLKRKADEFVAQDDSKNSNVYVQGLPLDLTEQEFADFMKKCGIIAEDPETGEKKIKLYRDEQGNLKGDGRCKYYKVESVPLALSLLDQSEIRPGFPVTITKAVFTAHENYEGKRPNSQFNNKKKKKTKKVEDKLLAWHQDGADREKSKKVATVVVLKHMFDPNEFEKDPVLITEIKSDVQAECERFGKVKKVLVFDRHPEGVISVKFDKEEAVTACIEVMNGRFFDGRRVVAEEWDGVTNYQIEETDMEREERLAKWNAFIETEDDN